MIDYLRPQLRPRPSTSTLTSDLKDSRPADKVDNSGKENLIVVDNHTSP